MSTQDLALVARFDDPDAAYRLIAEAHRGLDAGQSAALNARIVLILANQIGDMKLLREALDLAKQAGQDGNRQSPPGRG
jgi:alkylation response protein AidB-like acyl-CoA dehydrogenase